MAVGRVEEACRVGIIGRVELMPAFATCLCDACGTTSVATSCVTLKVLQGSHINAWSGGVLQEPIGSSAASLLGASYVGSHVLVLGTPFFWLEVWVEEVRRVEVRARSC